MKITTFNPQIVTKDHDVAKDTIDTGTSKFNIMVSASGFILAVSQHTKDMD